MDENPNARNNGARYEVEDANVRSVVLTGVGLAVGTLLVCLMMWGLFNAMKSETAKHQPVNPMMDQQRIPPEPRLQEQPYLELRAMRKHEDEVLNSYGWVDKNAGRVRLPINRAMDAIVQRGLPVGVTNAPPK